MYGKVFGTHNWYFLNLCSAVQWWIQGQGAFEVPYAEDLRRGVSKIIM